MLRLCALALRASTNECNNKINVMWHYRDCKEVRINTFLLLGLAAISFAVSFAAYGKTDNSWAALAACVLLFGCMLLSSLFVLWPGGRVNAKSAFRAGSAATLSRFQVGIFLAWFIGVGGLSVWFWLNGL